MKSLKCNSLYIFLTLMLSLTCISVHATERLTASLNHGGNVRLFFDKNALVEALEAAQPQDTIILTRGEFTAPGVIDKAVKIQGVGAEATKINSGSGASSVNINIPDGQSGLWLEGLGFSYSLYVQSGLTDAVFRNCKIPGHFSLGDGKVSGCDVSQCNIVNDIIGSGEFENVYVHNCIIGSDQLKSSAIVDRCVITGFSSSGHGNHSVKNSVFRGSSVIPSKSGTSRLSKSMTLINVICSDTWLFEDGAYLENLIQLPYSEVSGLFKDNVNYELTDEAAAKYVVDGSQIGAYGGTMPYTLLSSMPRIVKAVVPSVVPADGKVQVQFEIEAAR